MEQRLFVSKFSISFGALIDDIDPNSLFTEKLHLSKITH